MALQLAHMVTSATTATRWSSSCSILSGSRLIFPFSSSSSAAAAPTAWPVLWVTCSSEKPPSLRPDLQESTERSTISQANVDQQQAQTTSNAPLPRPELERRSFASLFAVDGPGPETINGRMAMVGFVWALVAEKVTGLGVVDQLFDPSTSGLLWFAAVVLLFTIASSIPFTNGESTDARRWGPFNGKAERWNGRLAMLGFAALVVSEVVRQAPILHI